MRDQYPTECRVLSASAVGSICEYKNINIYIVHEVCNIAWGGSPYVTVCCCPRATWVNPVYTPYQLE